MIVATSKCSGSNSIECPNNTDKCVSDLYNCIDNTSKEKCSDKNKPFYCEDLKTCVKSRNECGCPDGYSKCPYTVPFDVCIESTKLDELCPFYLPISCQKLDWSYLVTCPNGICHTSVNECANKRVCPLGSVLCPDLSCRSRLELCETYTSCSTSEVTCPDLTCVSNQKDCPSSTTCSNTNQVVCPDGECVDNEYMCKKLPSCSDDVPILCNTNYCASKYVNCPKAISCGQGKSLCSDNICRSSCSNITSTEVTK